MVVWQRGFPSPAEEGRDPVVSNVIEFLPGATKGQMRGLSLRIKSNFPENFLLVFQCNMLPLILVALLENKEYVLFIAV